MMEVRRMDMHFQFVCACMCVHALVCVCYVCMCVHLSHVRVHWTSQYLTLYIHVCTLLLQLSAPLRLNRALLSTLVEQNMDCVCMHVLHF